LLKLLCVGVKTHRSNPMQNFIARHSALMEQLWRSS